MAISAEQTEARSLHQVCSEEGRVRSDQKLMLEIQTRLGRTKESPGRLMVQGKGWMKKRRKFDANQATTSTRFLGAAVDVVLMYT